MSDQLLQLLNTARGFDASTRDRVVIAAGLEAGARLMSWWASQELAAAQALHEMGVPAEVVVAQATRCNQRDAERVIERSNTAQEVPVFGDALAEGRVAGGHIDQLAVSIRRLEPHHRTTLLADASRLVAIAAASTPEEFGRALRAEERRISADDGMDRLQRQRAAVRLQRRVDTDGMNIYTLALDPVEGLKLHNKIAAVTEALFHDATPELCPSDPFEKQAFLRAHAFLRIVEGKGIRLGRPETTVVVDTTVTDVNGAPVVDWGLPVEVPHKILLDLFPNSDVHSVVVRNGAILHAPGELNLGRSTRLANRAQRRALRAIYPTCAIPGCTVPFDRCEVHHVQWWECGGATDLDNLLPICIGKHHSAVHKGQVVLYLKHDRTLTVTRPDGTTQTTGPPKRRAA